LSVLENDDFDTLTDKVCMEIACTWCYGLARYYVDHSIWPIQEIYNTDPQEKA